MTVVGPEGVDRFLLECTRVPASSPLTPEAFLRRDAYAPLPSLVRAARDLFAREPLPRIKRARAATEPAVNRVTEIAHRAAATSTRHLVLLTGVPGAGKTLVGLQRRPRHPTRRGRQGLRQGREELRQGLRPEEALDSALAANWQSASRGTEFSGQKLVTLGVGQNLDVDSP